jgi:two-component system, response regulator PdtaR
VDLNCIGPWNGIPPRVLPSVPASSRSPVTILMVEDEALTRLLGAGMLAQAGFQVIEAGDGYEALEFLEADSDVQLLFTDVHLTGALDGLALARQVHQRWPGIGIIVVSGQASPRPGELPAGSHFHRKPYDADAVVRHARELTAAEGPSLSA